MIFMKIKSDVFDIFGTFSRYLEKKFQDIKKKKNGDVRKHISAILGVIFVSRLSWEGRHKKGSSQILQ